LYHRNPKYKVLLKLNRIYNKINIARSVTKKHVDAAAKWRTIEIA